MQNIIVLQELNFFSEMESILLTIRLQMHSSLVKNHLETII